MMRRFRHETGATKAHEAWGPLMRQLDGLAEDIMDAEPVTLAGLAIQAEVCCWQAVSYMAGGPLDWSQAQVYQLVVNLFRAAGEVVPAFLEDAVEDDEEDDWEA